ncbi:hypothetical protein M2D63_025660, partial [Pseudomonas sp. BJa5]|uniref:hypothetical protein n=1 Tax=Pseudomonas sp. BJa5 TaxID=2936270 RepID=UPI002559DCB2
MGSLCLHLLENKKNKYRFIYNFLSYQQTDKKKPRTRRGFSFQPDLQEVVSVVEDQTGLVLVSNAFALAAERT